ncbi:uncharacterized protein LOC143283934 [Babylonia areolata]|uniref:uncharacterized protein LOC143283934 n=1 Tax=Babylonia areolata TaxID=304850 RepID=UPI003FD5CFAE
MPRDTFASPRVSTKHQIPSRYLGKSIHGKTISKTVGIGTLSTNFRAEACALLLAAQTFIQEDTQPTNIVFLNDCKSILQSLQAPGGEEILRDIRQEPNFHKQRTAVVQQWIPSHCGIGGNEEADRLSKADSKLEQPALQRGPQTPYHILHSCPTFDALRRQA